MAAGMITRHYEHPDGATATLEMPAGYSRACYYVLTVRNTDGSITPQTKTYTTPEEARQAAVERERHAMGDGWRPKMAAKAPVITMPTLHRPSGEGIMLLVENIEERQEDSTWMAGTFLAADVVLDIQATAIGGEQPQLHIGDRVLVRRFDGVEQLLAAILKDVRWSVEVGTSAWSYSLHCVVVPLEGDERIAIQRWSDREHVIVDLVDWPGGMQGLWDEIGKRVQDPSARVQVQQEIIRRRSEREAAAERERQAAAARAREETEAALAMVESTRRRERRPEPPRPILVQDAMRKLSGGEDLSKPKRRKIDLED